MTLTSFFLIIFICSFVCKYVQSNGRKCAMSSVEQTSCQILLFGLHPFAQQALHAKQNGLEIWCAMKTTAIGLEA
jgi:hypothetical protein